jgi:ubiquinone/menaquinone biosynthesis C-methylase UbiE
MSDKGDVARFERVDSQQDPSYFVKFLDARKEIPEDATIKRQIIDWLQPLEGKYILDVGCGTGDDSREIARHVGPKGRVTAIDFSAAMVAEAGKRNADTPGLPVEFHEGDATQLVFADGFFDIARVERVLMHLRDASKGLEEMIRVVRSGGRVIASEVDQETLFFDSPYIEVMRRVVTSLADAMPSPRIGRSLAGLMRQAGLQNVRSHARVIKIPLNFARIGMSGHVDKCVQQGVISAQDAERWWQHLEAANATGEFHAGAIVFTVMADKV